MVDDEEIVISQTTARTLEPISKAGLKDGSANGQTAAFQSSFDEGYLEGFSFGFKLGVYHAESQTSSSSRQDVFHLQDKGKINCQLCNGTATTEQSVSVISEVQKDKNLEFLS